MKPNDVVSTTGRPIPPELLATMLAEMPELRDAADWDPELHPRDEQGQFAEVGSKGDKRATANLDYALRVAKELGFRQDRVRVEPQGRTFALNGKIHRSAATYGPFGIEPGGHITLYADSLGRMSPSETAKVMAHEVAHDMFAGAVEEPGGMPKQMTRQMREFNEFLSAQRESLVKDDGVSDYSRDWWGEYERTPEPTGFADPADAGPWRPYDDPETPWLNDSTGEVRATIPDPDDDLLERQQAEKDRMFMTAANETLAEISALAWRGRGQLGRAVKPMWKVAWDMLVDAHRSRTGIVLYGIDTRKLKVAAGVIDFLSKPGTAFYLTSDFEPVSADSPDARVLKVIYEDGERAFYVIEPERGNED